MSRPPHAHLHVVMRNCMYTPSMPKTVQIRDLDDEVYATLAGRAAAAGMSVPELLRREATRLASRPSLDEWLERIPRGRSRTTTGEVIEALDEMRGEWPDARP